MKKLVYLLCSMQILLMSCAVKKNIKEREFLTSDYKKVYFVNCLKYGFNNSKAINEVLDQDNSISAEFVHGVKNYKILDSLGRLTSKEIKKDSIELNYPENRGKRVLDKCLSGYNSRLLDSMARSTYKLEK